jgi:lipoprotein-releasing system permease protein
LQYELRIALRYLRARRQEGSLSLVSVIAIGGVALGVIALVVVLAVMTGFEADLREKILGTSAHLVVDGGAQEMLGQHEELGRRLAAVRGVVAASPFVVVKAMLRSGSHTDGVVLRGVDPALARGVLRVPEQLVHGSFDQLSGLVESPLPDESAVPGIVLGEVLASSLRVFVGERVQLLIPGAVSTPFGRQPRVRTFQVVGIFRSRIYEYDSSWAYSSLSGARSLLGLQGGVSGFELKVEEIFEAPAVAARVRASLGGELRVRDWRQLNAAFFAALQLEKWAMFIILCLIVMVAAFNIVSTLSMKVMEKTKDIGVLKAIGSTDGSVLKVFLYEGLAIGLSGTVLGMILGTGFCWLADRYRLVTVGTDLYNLSYLPFKMEALDLVSVFAASLLISVVTTLLPSLQAARLDPVEAMRNE